MAVITQLSSSNSLSSISGTKISSSAATDTSSNSAALDKAKELKDRFLSILLTQMQHQNPTDPMDTKEFTGQLTQFSSLEQQIDTNTKLENLVSTLSQSNISSAFNYIGRKVELATPTTAFQNDFANWTYAIPSNAKSVEMTVTDSSGAVVYSGKMQNNSGRTDVAAGTYSLNLSESDFSKAIEEGKVLKLSIKATTEDNKQLTADIHTIVNVDSLQSDSKGTFLQAGGMIFEIGDIRKIYSAQDLASTTTTSDTTTN